MRQEGRLAGLAGDAGDVDDLAAQAILAPRLGEHLARRSLAAEEGALGVDVDIEVPVGLADLDEALHRADSGIAAPQINAAEFAGDPLHGPGDHRALGDVELGGDGGSAGLSDEEGSVLGFAKVTVGDRDRGAEACQSQRDGTPDAVVGAGHGGEAVGKCLVFGFHHQATITLVSFWRLFSSPGSASWPVISVCAEESVSMTPSELRPSLL